MQNIEQILSAVNERVDFERARFGPVPEPESKPEPEPEQTDAPSTKIIEALAANEDGDGQLFVELNRGRFLYDAAAGRWYVSRGHYWEKDTLGETARAIDGVIELYAEESQRQAWRRLQSEKAGRTDEAKQHKDTEDKLLKRIRALQNIFFPGNGLKRSNPL